MSNIKVTAPTIPIKTIHIYDRIIMVATRITLVEHRSGHLN